MVRPLWKLMLEDASNLTCDECFAVMEYYAEILTRGGPDLLPQVLDHLKNCPNCAFQHREVLHRLEVAHLEMDAAPLADVTASRGSSIEYQRHDRQGREKSRRDDP